MGIATSMAGGSGAEFFVARGYRPLRLDSQRGDLPPVGPGESHQRMER